MTYLPTLMDISLISEGSGVASTWPPAALVGYAYGSPCVRPAMNSDVFRTGTPSWISRRRAWDLHSGHADPSCGIRALAMQAMAIPHKHMGLVNYPLSTSAGHYVLYAHDASPGLTTSFLELPNA